MQEASRLMELKVERGGTASTISQRDANGKEKRGKKKPWFHTPQGGALPDLERRSGHSSPVPRRSAWEKAKGRSECHGR